MAQITQNGITFNDVYNINNAYVNSAGILKMYKSGTVSEFYNSDQFQIVEAPDIKWCGVEVEDGVVINTTGELLSWIKSKLDNVSPEILEKLAVLELINISRLLTREVADQYYQEKGDYADVTSLEELNEWVEQLSNSVSYKVDADDLVENYKTSSEVTEEIQNAIQSAIVDLVNNAPEELNTLKEIADQLVDDESVVSQILDTIAQKIDAADVYTKNEIDELLEEIEIQQGIPGENGKSAYELYLDTVNEANAVYSFQSFDPTGETQYGEGTVEVIDLRNDGATVKVLTNTDFGDSGVDFVGQEFNVNTLNADELITLYSTEGLEQPIAVRVALVSEAVVAMTEQEWLESLKGEQGPQGLQGPQGETGTFDSSELENYATKQEIAEAGYLTQHQDLSDYATKQEIAEAGYLTQHQDLSDYATKQDLENIVGEDVPKNFDTLKEFADAMADLKVVDVEAIEAVEGEHYTQEEINEAQEGDDAYGKTVNDWKVEPVEAVDEVSHNMTIAEFVNTAMEEVNEKPQVAALTRKYEALLTLLNLRNTDVNNIIINQELEESNNVTFEDGTVDNITIPVTNQAYTVTAPLEDDATVTLSSNKYMTLFNTSEQPVDVTVQRPAEQGETGTSGTTVYLVGEYDTLTLENVSPNVKSGQDAAKVNNVVISQDNTKNLTLALDFQDGATITNNSNTNVTITDKNDSETVLTIVAPNSTVTLNGGTFETLTATVSDNTLVIKKTAHIGDLIINHGNVTVEVARESDISNVITGNIILGEPKESLVVDHTNFADVRYTALNDYYNNYPTEANQDGTTWPAFTPSKFPWLVINHNFDGDTEVTVYYQGEKVFDGWKPSAQVEQEGGTLVDRTYAILSVPEDLGLTQFTESTEGNEILLNGEDIEVRLVNSTVDYLHDDITSANISKLTSTGTHTLTEDIAKNGRFAPGIFASDDIVWNLNGHNITFTNTQGYANFLLRGTLHLEINGEGTVTNNAGDYGFWAAAEGVKVVINGGTYYAATHVLYAEKGTIEVNGGEFHLTDEATADKDQNGNFKFLLNCLDASYTAGTANIIVRGGKFYGFNPAESYGEPNGPVSYVAEGYESVPTNEAYEYGTVYEVRPITE